MNVEATADKPETAALLANAVAQAFRDHLQGGASPGGPEGDLPARLQRLEADAEAARQAANAFRMSRDFGDDNNKAALQREFADSKAETARIAAEANSLNGASAESLVRKGVPESMRSGALGALVERYRTAGQGAKRSRSRPRSRRRFQASAASCRPILRMRSNVNKSSRRHCRFRLDARHGRRQSPPANAGARCSGEAGAV